MGWKSTIDISRKEAIDLIFRKLSEVNRMSNNDLSKLIENIGFGDDIKLPYYGCNFHVTDGFIKEKDDNSL